MEMRPSRVLEKLRQGKVVSCFKTNLTCSRVAEIAGMFGFDCLWAEMEHAATDWSVIEKQVLASKVYDMDVMVRVAKGSYSDYIRPLELDAAGIMVPHLMSLKEAQNLVRMTRFHPTGRRPIDGGNTDGSYCNIAWADYTRQANQKRFVAVQIEDPEPLPELEAIASLEGIDMLFFGPGDFSHAIGAVGVWDHPEIIRTRKEVARVARACGKFAGTPGSPENLDELIEMGYRFITMGADVVGLSAYCKSLMAAFQKRDSSS